MCFTRVCNEKIDWKCFKSGKRNPKAHNVKPMSSCQSTGVSGMWAGAPPLCSEPKAQADVCEKPHFWVEFQRPAQRFGEWYVCCGGSGVGWGDTSLIFSAERREDIALGPQFLLMLPHSQGPDFRGGPP